MHNTVFLDIETSGLDPQLHDIIEVAMIVQDGPEINFALPFRLSNADPKALEVNKYSRRSLELRNMKITEHKAWAKFEVYLEDAVVVGNNVGFDLRFIEQFMRRMGAPNPMPWYYNPVELKALVAGWSGKLGPAPWSTKDVAEAVGIPIPSNAHTALADARWNQAVYNKVVGPRSAG